MYTLAGENLFSDGIVLAGPGPIPKRGLNCRPLQGGAIWTLGGGSGAGRERERERGLLWNNASSLSLLSAKISPEDAIRGTARALLSLSLLHAGPRGEIVIFLTTGERERGAKLCQNCQCVAIPQKKGPASRTLFTWLCNPYG